MRKAAVLSVAALVWAWSLASPAGAWLLSTVAGGGGEMPAVGVGALSLSLWTYAVGIGPDGRLYLPRYEVPWREGDALLRIGHDGKVDWAVTALPQYIDEILVLGDGGVLVTSQIRVGKVLPEGSYVVVAGAGKLGVPEAAREDPGWAGDGAPAVKAGISEASGLAVDASGNLYISDWRSSTIRRVDAADGTITRVAGRYFENGWAGDGGPAAEALLNAPSKIAFDGAGNLLIADQMNDCLRRIDRAGVITTVAGRPGAVEVLSKPVGVAVDAWGNIYVADQANHRIRRIGPDGKIETVAGTGQPGDTDRADDPARGALKRPVGVAVDRDGQLYVADYGNKKIKRLAFGPVVAGVEPAEAAPGGQVVVTGRYFGSDRGEGRVTLGGAEMPVASWTNTRIVATVPDGAATGRLTVRAEGGEGRAPSDLKVKR